MSTDNEHSLIYSKVEVRNDVMQVYDSMMSIYYIGVVCSRTFRCIHMDCPCSGTVG